MEEPKLNSQAIWKHNGDLHITGKLFINGKEITGNGNGSGGSGGGGGIPPELTTDQEKMLGEFGNSLKIKVGRSNLSLECLGISNQNRESCLILTN